MLHIYFTDGLPIAIINNKLHNQIFTRRLTTQPKTHNFVKDSNTTRILFWLYLKKFHINKILHYYIVVCCWWLFYHYNLSFFLIPVSLSRVSIIYYRWQISYLRTIERSAALRESKPPSSPSNCERIEPGMPLTILQYPQILQNIYRNIPKYIGE